MYLTLAKQQLMNTYSLYDVLVVCPNDAQNKEKSTNATRYFDIVFIEKGQGTFTLNNEKHQFIDEDIFIIPKEITYHFENKISDKIHYFSFTEKLFSSKVKNAAFRYWLQRIEQILNFPYAYLQDVISVEDDRKIVWDLHKIVLEELKNERKFYREIVIQAVNTILSIIARNVSRKHEILPLVPRKKSAKIKNIIDFIQQNIYNKEMTKISFISNKFNISPSSLSTGFKKTTGESLHQYLTKYKMKLATDRLVKTSYTVAQIANQLGFTDESHLTKTFKKFFGKSPKQFRQEMSKN